MLPFINLDDYERIPAGIKPQDLCEAIQHAINSFPDECCGIFTTQGYKPLTNTAEDRVNHFVFKENRLIAHIEGQVISLFHSHTTGNKWASKDDMATQHASAKPHGICVVSRNESSGESKVEDLFFWGSKNVPSLLGRNYRSGTMDCYSLIRDAYRLWYKIDLPDFPRNPDSFEKGDNLYEDGFATAGFLQIDPSEVSPGDILLGKILSSSVNHGAVVIDNRTIIHHYRDELSRRDDLSKWFHRMNICLRHKSFGSKPPLPQIF